MTRSAATSTSARIEEAGRSDERAHAPDIVGHHRASPFEPVALGGALAKTPGERRRHLPRGGMAGDEAGEEIAHIGAERAHPVAALLHDEGRVALLAEHVAELLEVARPIGPGAGRVAPRGIEPGRHHEKGRAEAADAARAPPPPRPVLLGRDVLRQRDVEIVAGAGPDPGLVAEAGEIGIGEARMAVDRDGEHVGARVEDLLLAVAVVIVDVEDGDACRSAPADWRRSPRC